MDIIRPTRVVAAHTWFRDLDLPVPVRWYCSLLHETARAPSNDISYFRVQDLRIMKSNKGLLHEYVVATVVAADRLSEYTDCAYLAFERYSTDRRGRGLRPTTNISGSGADYIGPHDDVAHAHAFGEQPRNNTSNGSRLSGATFEGVTVVVGSFEEGNLSNPSLNSNIPSSKLIHKLRNFCTLHLRNSFEASAGSLDSSSNMVHPFQAKDYVRLLAKPTKRAGDNQVGLLTFNNPNSPLHFYELAFLALAVSEKQPNYSPKFHCYWFAEMIAFALEELKGLRLPKSPKRGKGPFLNWEAMSKPEAMEELIQEYEKHKSAFVTEFTTAKEKAAEAEQWKAKAQQLDALRNSP